jgi:hypothetical protein
LPWAVAIGALQAIEKIVRRARNYSSQNNCWDTTAQNNFWVTTAQNNFWNTSFQNNFWITTARRAEIATAQGNALGGIK